MAITMINEQKKYLKLISNLLKGNSEGFLVDHLNNIILISDVDPDRFVDDVKRLFGGIGTLNDIVLSKNGRPLIKENDELDALRKKLYELCSAYKYH